MTDKNKDSEGKELKDEAVEQVSGGAFFDHYSDEDYYKAGVEITDPGDQFNDGYILKASGEKLTSEQAAGAIAYYERYGRPADNVSQIEIFFLRREKEGPWWLKKINYWQKHSLWYGTLKQSLFF